MRRCLRRPHWRMAILTASGLMTTAAFAQQPQPALTCIAQPATASPGDTVNIEAQFNAPQASSKPPVYTWTSSGGRITPTQRGAHVDTAGLADGNYVVNGHASTGRGKTRNADCTTAFRVVALAPPTLACAANPPSIVPGGFTTITATAASPQNRTLTYSYGTTAGQITGKGPIGTLAATDVNPGPVKVTCNVVDDRGQAASVSITVNVRTPPPPPLAPAPEPRKLCSAGFERDHARPVRVDNEAKGCLDDIALQLMRDPGATLMIVGKHGPSEPPQAAAERGLNVRQYMTTEKRIDASRIQVRTGDNTAKSADNILVPQGATWDPAGTATFDPTSIERHGEAYARAAARPTR